MTEWAGLPLNTRHTFCQGGTSSGFSLVYNKDGNRMKQKIINAILCLFFLAGFGITLYPAFSDWYISRHQGQVIEDYDEKAAQMSQKELKKELDKAHIYNTQLLGNVVLTDPFDADAVKEQNADYNNILNVDGDGVMGSIEIPSIKVYLPIYHGTDSTSLEKGAGHLENSSFPVGGRGTHAVISAHTGLPSAKMFDNLTEVKEGDVFYIHVLNQTLAYEVNQIKVVLPENTSDLLINRNEDYVTMVTCTPYGINSHRLLIHAMRVPYKGETKDAKEALKENLWQWLLKQKTLLVSVALLLLLLIYFIIQRIKARREKKRREMERRARRQRQIREKGGK